MKSFLDEFNDNTLSWNTDDENDDDNSSFSTSSYSSSDHEIEVVEVDNNDNGNLDDDDDDDSNNNRLQPEIGMIHQGVQQQEQQDQPVVAVPVLMQPQPQPQRPPLINNIPLIAPIAANIQNEMYAGTNQIIYNNLRHHPQTNSMIFRVAQCEELPLVRAEIDWKLVQEQLPSYSAPQIGDELGAHLLQSALRLDPPIDVISDIIRYYPKSCVNMDSFYAACQHASDDAVQLLMRRTMRARKTEGITWGMLAFLGDARIRIQHARVLLQCVPEALVDPMHGMFGVSPLDRMMSGAFIHGGYLEWVEKLKLALWTAANGSLNEWGNHPFYPFHDIIKRLVSSDFMGVQFGALSFVNSLTACIEAEATVQSSDDDPPFHQLDASGNLPLHIALQKECDTNLGVIGERKLIKFLVHSNPQSAMKRDGNGVLPIVLAVTNGWPVYDIIINTCLPEYIQGQTAQNTDRQLETSFLLHDVLNCNFHQRFGIEGARSIIKFILKKNPSSVDLPHENGCLPLHIGIKNGWPCHDLLIVASPSTLENKDPQTHLYPFMLAAKPKSQIRENKSLNELSALYEMIRWGPSLLKGTGENVTLDDKGSIKRKQSTMTLNHPPIKKNCAC